MNNTIQINRMGGGRNRLIDIYKGVCILFVIFTHYGWTTEAWHKMMFPFWIDMAVPIFMVISGYVNAKSFEVKNIRCLEDAYQKSLLITKLIRFLVPFLITFALETVIQIIFHRFTIKSFVVDFFHGGYGPGSYYFPVMVQFILVYPIIHFIVEKNGMKGVILCFVINLFYEFLQRISFVPEELYRLLCFRYISVIAFGTFFALFSNIKIKWYINTIVGILGIMFIVLVEYTSYSPKIIIYWTRTSCIATLYLFPLCSFLLKSRDKEIRCAPFELFGKASFNIYLVQMVYFWCVSGKVYSNTNSIIVRIFLNFLICLIGGISFYYIESKLTGKIIKRIKSNELFIFNSRQRRQ